MTLRLHPGPTAGPQTWLMAIVINKHTSCIIHNTWYVMMHNGNDSKHNINNKSNDNDITTNTNDNNNDDSDIHYN